MKIKSPKLSYKQIGKIADEFLLKYHPSLKLPIPIEEIAEKELNLEIIPQKRHHQKQYIQ